MISENKIVFLIFVMIVIQLTIAAPSKRNRISCNNCVCGNRGRSNRIIGGSISQPYDHPWLVGLRKKGKVECGATIISNRFLLTAAHCVYGMEKKQIQALLGGYEIVKDYKLMRRIRNVYIHESYNYVTFNNDIALLEMDESITFSTGIQPACLPSPDASNYTGSYATVAGWGRIQEHGKESPVVRSVVIPIWSREQCFTSDYENHKITENMICGGYKDGGRDACQGDSGGPMVLKGRTGSMELIGVVSWGRGCARPNLPGVYTRIVNYLQWIKSKIGDDCLCVPKYFL